MAPARRPRKTELRPPLQISRQLCASRAAAGTGRSQPPRPRNCCLSRASRHFKRRSGGFPQKSPAFRARSWKKYSRDSLLGRAGVSRRAPVGGSRAIARCRPATRAGLRRAAAAAMRQVAVLEGAVGVVAARAGEDEAGDAAGAQAGAERRGGARRRRWPTSRRASRPRCPRPAPRM